MAGERLGYGVTFNPPWRTGAIGFSPATGRLDDRLVAFLAQGQHAYPVFSYQPKRCAAVLAAAN